MKKSIFIILTFFPFIVLSINPEDFKFDVNKINNPRVTNGWVTVVGNYLTDNEINLINNEIDNIEKESGSEIAVVVVPKAGDIFTSAQDLFDKWKIGKKDKNNGLLILVSMEDRQFRTHTGYGMEGIFTDALIRTLQDTIVVPEFKAGKYGEGIINYIKKIHEIIKDPAISQTLLDDYEKNNLVKTDSKKSNDLRNITIVFSIIGFIFLLSGFIWLFMSMKKILSSSKKEFNKYTKIKELEEKGLGESGSLGSLFVFIFGGIFFIVGVRVTGIIPAMIGNSLSLLPAAGIVLAVLLSIFGFSRKKNIIAKWRHDPRNCPQCGSVMNKLDEVSDDSYLQGFQKIEENIKSIDYDVWICDKCSNKIIEKFRGNKYGIYTECPACRGITGKHLKTIIISHPTYSSTGKREITFNCLGCGNKFSKFETIPRLERSSSSGSGSSSSSGGSSFGGGSSGGGGATSSW
jgi:uncharacterized protein